MLVRDDIVRDSAVAAVAIFAIRNWLVGVVWIWVLEDHVPGVQKAWKEPETAKRKVDQRFGATEALLDPHAYGWELFVVLACQSPKSSSTILPSLLRRQRRGAANVPGR